METTEIYTRPLGVNVDTVMGDETPVPGFRESSADLNEVVTHVKTVFAKARDVNEYIEFANSSFAKALDESPIHMNVDTVKALSGNETPVPGFLDTGLMKCKNEKECLKEFEKTLIKNYNEIDKIQRINDGLSELACMGKEFDETFTKFYDNASKFEGDIAARRENSQEMRDAYDENIKQCLEKKTLTFDENICEKCKTPGGFHKLECTDDAKLSDEEPTITEVNESLLDEPDIIEDVEMTEEAQEAIAFFFEGVDPSKLDIRINDDGGVSVVFPNHHLIISGGGKVFTLVSYSGSLAGSEYAENTRVFGEMDKEILADLIRKEFNIVKEVNKDHPIVIKLKKGFDQLGMRKFIREINEFLVKSSEEGKKISKITVTTEEWKNSVQHFIFINAAKKMFAKYAEQGLLAVFVFNGFLEAANELYCMGYVKGKPNGKGVVFKNVNMADFKQKLAVSAENLHKYSTLDLELFEKDVLYDGNN